MKLYLKILSHFLIKEHCFIWIFVHNSASYSWTTKVSTTFKIAKWYFCLYNRVCKYTTAVSQNHRITEWPRLEGTSRIMNLKSPCHRQGHQLPHLILDQAAQGPIQPALEHLQGWGIHSLSGQPVPAPHHSCSKEFIQADCGSLSLPLSVTM